ncbi:polysaccharide biosynthesis/export family protein [Mucilaginibacter sabulilitoris]|uniref:Polysaccharide biosynthesis/export family protein n=1 Tax=Mucilaginibacter sabulilitoris TaxID=1173583 RepID=A0ABZ0THI3_9SPHI|nr:polysaccharide biosynthesis/export family protein [Mucilaginibacter sabulilitoris]WPU92061.1 polysaccharide biosynthesis/export family protein [Mucilaginibacter sabulilitoris]
MQKTPLNNFTYRIKPQDILQIRNLQSVKYIVDEAPPAGNITTGGNATTGQTYQVEDDSTVALPVIGHVKVVGLTRAEAAKQIEALYRKSLLKDPQVYRARHNHHLETGPYLRRKPKRKRYRFLDK